MNLSEYICGDFFEKQCDVSFGGYTWGYVSNNQIDINLSLIDNACDNPFVYIDGNRVNLFFSVLKITNYKKPFYLVTHNSDITFDNNIDIPECIIKWYGQNINFVNARVQSIPIGLERNGWFPHKRSTLSGESNSDKNKLLYFNCNINTNITKRKIAYTTMQRNDFCVIRDGLEYTEYISDLRSSFFVLSPDGNGIDCHRTWEALYSNSVPILLESYSHQMCYKDLPVLIVPTWDILTKEFLSEKIGDYYDNNGLLINRDRLESKNFLLKNANK